MMISPLFVATAWPVVGSAFTVAARALAWLTPRARFSPVLEWAIPRERMIVTWRMLACAPVGPDIVVSMPCIWPCTCNTMSPNGISMPCCCIASAAEADWVCTRASICDRNAANVTTALAEAGSKSA
jgi:hypothetical protein